MRNWIIISLLMIVCSCGKSPEPMVQGKDVLVGLRLSSGGVVSVNCDNHGVEVTRGVTEMSQQSQIKDEISNFWVVQYDGLDDDALIVGQARYYPDMETYLKPSDQGGNDEQIKLVASDKVNLLVIIANTFDPGMSFPQGSTLSDFKKKLRTVASDGDVMFSDGADRYLVLSGSVYGAIREGTFFTCSLKRNVAKADIRIINSSSDVNIISWRMRSVPSVSYYFTNFELPEIYPAVGEFTGVDYPEVTHAISPGSHADYTVYLPVNKWGVVDDVRNEAYKNVYAPDGATYLEINAESNGEPVAYRFYLGENMTTDFNILPNTSYSYTFDINSVGDPEYDSRVEYPSLVNFANTNDESANCYVLNPDNSGGLTRRFRIPVKRVDEFWGNNGYENVPEYTLGTDKEWVVELIACNFDNSDSRLVLRKSEGVGSYDHVKEELQYFEVEVKPGTAGNAIIALRRKGPDNPILWSWHLWITDYDPEEAFGHIPQDEVYAYPVTGGVVHRYEGAVWSGDYARRFIMDRNLGSPSVDNLNAGNGALYYQFGRKDPLFGDKSVEGSKFTMIDYNSIYDPSQPISTLVYSIQNPLVFIDHRDAVSRRAWTEGNKYNPELFDGTIVWHDPRTSSQHYMGTLMEKSVFDPCPPGYMIPQRGTWDDFRRNDMEKPTTNITEKSVLVRNFSSFDSVGGCQYWPYGDSGNDVKPSEVVYYPLTGYKEGPVVSSNTMYLYSLASTPIDYVTAVGMSVSRSSSGYTLTTQYGLGRNLALPVRCVTSRDVK